MERVKRLHSLFPTPRFRPAPALRAVPSRPRDRRAASRPDVSTFPVARRLPCRHRGCPRHRRRRGAQPGRPPSGGAARHRERPPVAGMLFHPISGRARHAEVLGPRHVQDETVEVLLYRGRLLLPPASGPHQHDLIDEPQYWGTPSVSVLATPSISVLMLKSGAGLRCERRARVARGAAPGQPAYPRVAA